MFVTSLFFVTFYLFSLLSLQVAGDGCKILALSGGGSYGSYELGVVSKMIVNGSGGWDLVTGVSAGSINALYLSTILIEDEKNIPELKQLWINTKSSDIYGYEFFLNGLSLYKTDALRKTLAGIYQNKKVIRPVIISATSLNKGNSVLFNETDIHNFGFVDPILASTAIPILFPPHSWNNDVYIDGGLSSNILIEEGISWCTENMPDETSRIHIDVVICGQQNTPIDFKLSTINYLERLIDIVKEQVEYHEVFDQIAYSNKVTITLYEQKEKGTVSLVDFNQGEKLFNDGFTESNLKIHHYSYDKKEEL